MESLEKTNTSVNNRFVWDMAEIILDKIYHLRQNLLLIHL